MTGGWLDPPHQPAMTRRNAYKAGKLHGWRVSEHAPQIDHEPALRLEVMLIGTTDQAARAYALGALRAYRQATGRPEPLMGHRVIA